MSSTVPIFDLINQFHLMALYRAYKIDLFDSLIFADIFEDDEKYKFIAESDDLESLLEFSVKEFHNANPKISNWQEWCEKAENGGWEVEIHRDKSPIFRASLLLVDPIVKNAAELALKWHRGVIRKAGGEQYIGHILAVTNILRLDNRVNPDKDLVVAGFCHDLLEDTECSEGEIESLCGAEVLRIVKACSNDKNLEGSKNWEDKKRKYIESVELGGDKAMLVSLADKIANLRALLELHQKVGDGIWSNFNRGKEQKIWFERSVLDMLRKHLSGHKLVEEYEILICKMESL